MARALSEQRQRILRYVYRYMREHERPPTVREIQYDLDFSSTAVVKHHLDRLEQDGYIYRVPRASRGLRLTEKAREWLASQGLLSVDEWRGEENVVRVPIAGYIRAGEPVAAYPTTVEEVDTLELTRDLLPETENVYALRVVGDSMVDASVHDGDLVILRQQEDAQDGDMVAVWLEDDQETTLKKLYREGAYVRLQPANPAYAPIVKPADVVRVQGKVIAIIRRLAA